MEKTSFYLPAAVHGEESKPSGCNQSLPKPKPGILLHHAVIGKKEKYRT
jgi:hypothetical protein